MRYIETFDNGPGGWFGWAGPNYQALEQRESAVVSRRPWWVDPNHAPPGAGYLHILFGLNTREDEGPLPFAGENRFIQSAAPTDFTDARISLRLRGDLQPNGSQLVLLVQADVASLGKRINSVLTAQPISITPHWSEQTITCVNYNDQWTCLGSRHDRTETYGWGPIAPLLQDVNCNIIFVLFPLDIVPAIPMTGDMHISRAGHNYQVDQTRLPQGHVELDEIQIDFPASQQTT